MEGEGLRSMETFLGQASKIVHFKNPTLLLHCCKAKCMKSLFSIISNAVSRIFFDMALLADACSWLRALFMLNVFRCYPRRPGMETPFETDYVYDMIF